MSMGLEGVPGREDGCTESGGPSAPARDLTLDTVGRRAVGSMRSALHVHVHV